MVNFTIRKGKFFGEMGYDIYINGKKEIWSKTKSKAERKIKVLQSAINKVARM